MSFRHCPPGTVAYVVVDTTDFGMTAPWSDELNDWDEDAEPELDADQAYRDWQDMHDSAAAALLGVFPSLYLDSQRAGRYWSSDFHATLRNEHAFIGFSDSGYGWATIWLAEDDESERPALARAWAEKAAGKFLATLGAKEDGEHLAQTPPADAAFRRSRFHKAPKPFPPGAHERTWMCDRPPSQVLGTPSSHGSSASSWLHYVQSLYASGHFQYAQKAPKDYLRLHGVPENEWRRYEWLFVMAMEHRME